MSATSTRRIQIALGVVWVLDGLLQLQPHMLTSAFVSHVLQPAAQGQPGWASWLLSTNARLVGTHTAGWNLLFAGVQLLIGAGLLYRPTAKPALALSIVWSLGVWSLGEGFGMIFTGSASPLTGAPGAVLIYGVIAVMVWPVGGGRLLGELGARRIWAAVWLLSAGLWVMPANMSHGAIGQQIASMASGEPGWLGHLDKVAGAYLTPAGPGLAFALALVSFTIGVGPLVSPKIGPYLVAGAVLSLSYWVFGQDFGGILTGPVSGTATDPNTGPLFVLMALALRPGTRSALVQPVRRLSFAAC